MKTTFKISEHIGKKKIEFHLVKKKKKSSSELIYCSKNIRRLHVINKKGESFDDSK